MPRYVQYLIARFFALLCILGAGYGYVTANVSIIFIFVLGGLALGVLSIYFQRTAQLHKDQDSVAVETLSRMRRR